MGGVKGDAAAASPSQGSVTQHRRKKWRHLLLLSPPAKGAAVGESLGEDLREEEAGKKCKRQ